MIIRLNKKYGLANKKQKLAICTLHKAIAAGIVGKSPKKRGPVPRIPNGLLEVVVPHTEVSQVSSGGELRGCDIKRLIGAATVGTQYKDQFTIESVW
jgi:hypothetical protein